MEQKEKMPRGPFGGIRLGSVFGIRMAADWSVLVIFLLVAVDLGARALPTWHPGWGAALTWSVALGAALLFFISILVHELSHSLVAKAHGMGVRGITLFIFGGISQIEGEAPSPRAEFLVAVVGPLTSLALGVLGLLGAAAITGDELVAGTPEGLIEVLRRLGPVATLLLWLSTMNLVLGLFNLVPGFPLDGGRVLRSLLWWRTGDLEKATRWASRVGQAVAFAIIGWGVLVLFVNPVGGMFRILIGWFLNHAAKASYQQVLVERTLSGVPVRRLMRADLDTVPSDLTVDELVREHVMRSDQRCFPVLERERLVGLACLSDIRKVPEADWPRAPVNTIMTPAERLATVGADDAAEDALRKLGAQDVDQVPVVERDRLVGLLRRQEIVKWIALHLRDQRMA